MSTPLVQILEALPERADVRVEDRGLHLWIVLLEQEGLLDRVHAAEVGAIEHPARHGTRADALDETDPLRMAPVGGTYQLAIGGPTGVDETLELHVGDDVLEAGVSVLVVGSRVVDVHAGGDDNASHLQVDELVLDVEVDAFLLADLEALATRDGVEPEAVVGVEGEGRRDRLGERAVDGLARRETLLVFVGNDDRAHRGAQVAGGALACVYVLGATPHSGLEASHEARDVLDL